MIELGVAVLPLAVRYDGIWDVPFSLAICDGCSGFRMNFRFAVLPLAIRHGGIWDVPFYADNFL